MVTALTVAKDKKSLSAPQALNSAEHKVVQEEPFQLYTETTAATVI